MYTLSANENKSKCLSVVKSGTTQSSWRREMLGKKKSKRNCCLTSAHLNIVPSRILCQHEDNYPTKCLIKQAGNFPVGGFIRTQVLVGEDLKRLQGVLEKNWPCLCWTVVHFQKELHTYICQSSKISCPNETEQWMSVRKIHFKLTAEYVHRPCHPRQILLLPAVR